MALQPKSPGAHHCHPLPELTWGLGQVGVSRNRLTDSDEKCGSCSERCHSHCLLLPQFHCVFDLKFLLFF